MRLQQLRVFLEIIEEGNYGRAALELGVSQPTVSHAIRTLEQDLGVRLLERGRFGARPTPVGERIAAHARLLLQLEAALEQEASIARGALRGELPLAVFESFGKYVLPGLLTRLRELHPDLRVRIVEVPETHVGFTAALTTGTVQVAIGAWEIPPECIGWELMCDEHRVVLPVDSPIGGERLDYEDLVDLPLILNEGSECTFRLQAYLADRGQHARHTLMVHGNDTVLHMVAAGLGVAILPELAIGTPGAAVRTVRFADLTRSIHVKLLPYNLKVPAVRAFLQALNERFPASGLPSVSVAWNPTEPPPVAEQPARLGARNERRPTRTLSTDT